MSGTIRGLHLLSPLFAALGLSLLGACGPDSSAQVHSSDAVYEDDLRRRHVCGDGRCTAKESCETCPADCGACVFPPADAGEAANDAGGPLYDAGGPGADDAGTVLDAGVPFDGGASLDSGVLDSGNPVDAGVVLDAGAGLDAGSPADAGGVLDASVPTPGTRMLARLPIVVVTFTGSSGNLISEPARRGVEFAREFIFRNSHGGLDFAITYVNYAGRAPDTGGDWWKQADAIALRLIADYGFAVGQFYGMYWYGPGAVGLLGGGGGTALGFYGQGSGGQCMAEQSPACSSLGQAACTSRDDCAWNAGAARCEYPYWSRCAHFGLWDFPAGRPSGEPGGTVNYDAAWLFLHEFAGHAVEGNLAAAAGRAIYFAHPDSTVLNPANVAGTPQAYVGAPPLGSAWDSAWMGGALRTVPAEDFPKIPCPIVGGCALTVLDTDRDGLADSDPRLPMDEIRFGSDPTRADTDGDGLSDLEEYAADTYRSSLPRVADSDGDGRADGVDRLPTDPFQTEVLKRTPLIDGVVSGTEGWTLVADRPSTVRWDDPAKRGTPYDARLWAAWDDSFLYLAVDGPGLNGIFSGIDGDGSNTVWIGADSYSLRFDVGSKALVFQVNGNANYFLAGAKAVTTTVSGRVAVEIAIPKLMGGQRGGGFLPAPVTGIALADGAVVGLSLQAGFPGGAVMWPISDHLQFALKLRGAAHAPAKVLNTSVTPTDHGASVVVTTDLPAQARLCVTGPELVLPQCVLMRGMTLTSSFTFVPQRLLAGARYEYRIEVDDFDEGRSAPGTGSFVTTVGNFPPGTNLALAMPVRASYHTDSMREVVDGIRDGRVWNGWRWAGGNDPVPTGHWVDVDLRGRYPTREIRIYDSDDTWQRPVRAFHIEVSETGIFGPGDPTARSVASESSWNLAYPVTGDSFKSYVLPAGTQARYVRFVWNGGTNDWIGLPEMEVY